jgi:hypothetical protein
MTSNIFWDKRRLVILIIFKYSFRTSQRTHYVSITKQTGYAETNLYLFCESYEAHNTICGQNTEFSND